MCESSTCPLADDVRVSYIACMSSGNLSNRKLLRLTGARNKARWEYFNYSDPGNLTPPQKRAFKYRSMALLLQLEAAQIELDAEAEIQELLELEAA